MTDENEFNDLMSDFEIDQDKMTEIIEEHANGGGLVVASDVLPTGLPIIPLRPRPAFPGIMIPLVLNGQSQVAAMHQAMEHQAQTIGLVMVRELDDDDGIENLHKIGVAAKIVKVLHSEKNTAHVLVNSLERFEIEDIQERGLTIYARVRYHFAAELSVNPELRAYSMAILSTLKELVQINPLYSEEIKLFLNRSSLDDPGRLADFAANLTNSDGQQLQDILATFDVRKRIDKVLVLLKKELEVSRLQTKISKQIEEKVSAQQREFFLREQLKAIKQELGLEKEGKTTEIEKFQKRLKKLKMNEEAERAVEDEMEKLQLIEPSSPEYNVSRNYLDWLTILPWGLFSKDSYNIGRARRILDRDHYGLQDVKERILEFIAVGRMKGDISGSILCLVGPPGVGKTSIGHSIADALGRKFFRFSLGGMRDEAEIKGHRRTYIGAMPGKFIQAMKTVGTANPVIMLDEVDKIGASFQGDPASALLEVLDPEQNGSFRDHYLDVPFDLSNVLFIATANQLDTIPRPLLDRMEMIRLSGYILEEKLEIAKRYLIPRQIRENGLKERQINISDTALSKLITSYTREAGVRNLERVIGRVCRKLATKVAEGIVDGAVVVEAEDLYDYLGRALFYPETAERTEIPGVATGLGWTPFGGAIMFFDKTV